MNASIVPLLLTFAAGLPVETAAFDARLFVTSGKPADAPRHAIELGAKASLHLVTCRELEAPLPSASAPEPPRGAPPRPGRYRCTNGFPSDDAWGREATFYGQTNVGAPHEMLARVRRCYRLRDQPLPSSTLRALESALFDNTPFAQALASLSPAPRVLVLGRERVVAHPEYEVPCGRGRGGRDCFMGNPIIGYTRERVREVYFTGVIAAADVGPPFIPPEKPITAKLSLATASSDAEWLSLLEHARSGRWQEALAAATAREATLRRTEAPSTARWLAASNVAVAAHFLGEEQTMHAAVGRMNALATAALEEIEQLARTPLAAQAELLRGLVDGDTLATSDPCR